SPSMVSLRSFRAAPGRFPTRGRPYRMKGQDRGMSVMVRPHSLSSADCGQEEPLEDRRGITPTCSGRDDPAPQTAASSLVVFRAVRLEVSRDFFLARVVRPPERRSTIDLVMDVHMRAAFYEEPHD